MSDPPTGDPTPRYLDPRVLEQLGSMQVRARALVEGLIAGLHRSPHRGGSIEFAEYTEYSPGHELRHIDWKVFGKSDRYVVKQFEDETNLRAYMVLDGSGSMDYASEEAGLTKLRYVSFLAATLSYQLMRQGDAVGALAFDEQVRQYLPASSKTSHLDDLFFLLDQLPGRGRTSLNEALRVLSERAKARSLLFIFSDMLHVDDEALRFLRVLRSRRFEVALFHVLDPAELTLPFEGLTLFEGLEEDGELLADPDDLRTRYRALMQEHVSRVQRECEEGDIEYVRFLTTEPIEQVALRFLRRRAR